jgi:hypothetical protein
VLLLVGAGCGSNTIGPVGPFDIAFDLTIPPNRPAADLYAVSGVSSRTQLMRVGDSIVESTSQSFYAQFNVAPGITLPAQVLLNGNPLARNRDTDTLRLDEATSNSIYGNNTWKLVDSASGVDSFMIQQVDVVDSVGPFKDQKTFRGDIELHIGWTPPRIGSGGMYMIWKAPDTTISIPVADVGSFTLDGRDMAKLRGKGSVTFIRYLNIQKSYKGKRLNLTRLAQHNYEVTVQ